MLEFACFRRAVRLSLQDREHVLVFQPSAVEVHAQAGEWFKDAEI